MTEWKNTKKQRDALRGKYDGKCGYCGQSLTKMHADHVKPVGRLMTDVYGARLPASKCSMIKPELNVVENMMPSCAPCNLSKGGYPLEDWRELLGRSFELALKEKSIFKAAVRIGSIKVDCCPVVFYFESRVGG